MKIKKQLREEVENAEQRALTHFRKLQQIENILRIDKNKKTPSVFIVEKIEEVIVGKTNNF